MFVSPLVPVWRCRGMYLVFASIPGVAAATPAASAAELQAAGRRWGQRSRVPLQGATRLPCLPCTSRGPSQSVGFSQARDISAQTAVKEKLKQNGFYKPKSDDQKTSKKRLHSVWSVSILKANRGCGNIVPCKITEFGDLPYMQASM